MNLYLELVPFSERLPDLQEHASVLFALVEDNVVLEMCNADRSAAGGVYEVRDFYRTEIAPDQICGEWTHWAPVSIPTPQPAPAPSVVVLNDASLNQGTFFHESVYKTNAERLLKEHERRNGGSV